MEQFALNELLGYSNVSLYNFQNAKDIVFNLNNYTDTLHFSPEINKYMCDCLKDGTYLLTTKEEIDSSINEIRDYAMEASKYTDDNYGDQIKIQY